MPIIARDASARNERGGPASLTRRRSARPSSARAPGERGALPGRGWRTRPDEGFRARESLVAAPEPPLLSGRSKGPDGGSDGTKPNGAAKPLAVLGPPFLRVARAWRPAEIFGNIWNILEILGTPWNFLGTFFHLPGLMGFLGISRVCARGESILPPIAPEPWELRTLRPRGAGSVGTRANGDANEPKPATATIASQAASTLKAAAPWELPAVGVPGGFRGG